MEHESLRAYFGKQYGKELSDDEILEYKDKLVKFFSLLIEIDQKSRRKGNEYGEKDQ